MSDSGTHSLRLLVDPLLPLLATSQDHKRIFDGDAGPNTGGMGAYSPAPVVTPELHAKAMREIILPTVRGMAAEGTPYTGFLYAGLMIGKDGSVKTVEFNCRLGDPETQPILMRLKSDLRELIEHALANVPINQSIAITGSVDQFGRVQPVGGLNEKIEGFFTICQQRGFSRVGSVLT